MLRPSSCGWILSSSERCLVLDTDVGQVCSTMPALFTTFLLCFGPGIESEHGARTATGFFSGNSSYILVSRGLVVTSSVFMVVFL